nr:MAG TPA: hypothetical protein [Caudoviricetes sp.]
MNDFKKSIELSKEQLAYLEYKRKRFAKEIHKDKWKNIKIKGDNTNENNYKNK